MWSLLPLPLGPGRIRPLAVIDTGARAPIMGHTHGHSPRAAASIPIISREAHAIDAPIAGPAAFGPQQGLVALKHGIRARITVTQTVHRFVLRHACNTDRYLIVIRIANVNYANWDHLVIWWPQRCERRLRQITCRGIIDVNDVDIYIIRITKRSIGNT